MEGLHKIAPKYWKEILDDDSNILLWVSATWCPSSQVFTPIIWDLAWVLTGTAVKVCEIECVSRQGLPKKVVEFTGFDGRLPYFALLTKGYKSQYLKYLEETKQGAAKKTEQPDVDVWGRRNEMCGSADDFMLALLHFIHGRLSNEDTFDYQASCDRAQQIKGRVGFLGEAAASTRKKWLEILKTAAIQGESGSLSRVWKMAMTEADRFDESRSFPTKATDLVEVKFKHKLAEENHEKGKTMLQELQKLKQVVDCGDGFLPTSNKSREVEFCLWNLNIFSIDTCAWTFSVSFTLELQWQVQKSDFSGGKLNWEPPSVILQNSIDTQSNDQSETVMFLQCGEFWARRACCVTCTCRETYELENFPFDVQELNMYICWERSDKLWTLVPNQNLYLPSVQYSPLQAVPEWIMQPPITELFHQTFKPRLPECRDLSELFEKRHINLESMESDIRPVLIVKAVAKRSSYPFMFQVVYIYSLLGLVGNCVFFLTEDDAPDQFTIVLTGFLAACTFQSVVDAGLPKLGYISLFQKFMICMNLQILLPLVEICILRLPFLIAGPADDETTADSDGASQSLVLREASLHLLCFNVGGWILVHLVFALYVHFRALPHEKKKAIQMTPRQQLLRMSNKYNVMKYPEQRHKREDGNCFNFGGMGIVVLSDSANPKHMQEAEERCLAVEKSLAASTELVSARTCIRRPGKVMPTTNPGKESSALACPVKMWSPGVFCDVDQVLFTEEELRHVWKSVFDALDQDQSHSVDWAEIRQVVSNAKWGKVVELLFESDSDGDRCVSPEEWDVMLKRLLFQQGLPGLDSILTLKRLADERNAEARQHQFGKDVQVQLCRVNDSDTPPLCGLVPEPPHADGH